MKKAANKAAVGLVRDFGELERLQVSRKGVGNYVTSADIRAEQKIIEELTKFSSDYSFLCEESGYQNNENIKHRWVIDPIDGTNNFRRGIPYFCVNIALTVDDIPVAGLTLDPVRGACYKAALDMGAFVDGHNRLRVSSTSGLREAVIACHRVSQNRIQKLVDHFVIIRQMGSVALDLAYLGAGKYDVVIAEDVSWWDIAAGIVLVKESGGFIKYKSENGKYSVLATSSFKLMKEIALIKE